MMEWFDSHCHVDEEAFDEDHHEFAPAHEHFAPAPAHRPHDPGGGLLGRKPPGLAGIEHPVRHPALVQGIAGDVGAHAPRADEGDADAARIVFCLQGFEKAVERKFRGAVGAAQREAEAAGDGGGHGDVAPALFQHQR